MKLHNLKYALIIATAIGFTACQKESVTSEDANSPALASAQGQEQVNDIDAEAAFRLDPSRAGANGCPTVTWAADRGTFPNTVTIDFGDGCTGFNGRTKKGQLIVTMSADHFTAGAVRTVSPNEFYVDDIKVEGLRTVTNMGLNAEEQMYWTVVGNHTITDPEGDVGTHSINHVRTMTAGRDTEEECLDDEYSITGTHSGTTREGKSFEGLITVALVKRMDCRWPVSGVEAITTDARRGNRTIDFGDGTCDDKATVTTANGSTREITIRRR